MNKWLYLFLILLTLSGIYGIYEVGYSNGKTDEQIEVLRAGNSALRDLVTHVEEVDANLASQGAVIAQIRAKQLEKQTVITKEVVKYATNPNSNAICLDPNWVRVYNASLPNSGTKDTTATRPDGQAGRTGTDARKSK